jgi:hypothetical protein
MQNYTRGDRATLPLNDTDLENTYSVQDYLDVAVLDTDRVNQSATGEYAIHQYKDYLSTEIRCIIRWEGQTDVAPALSPVYLQIYNRNTNVWDTIDQNPTLYGATFSPYGAETPYYGGRNADTDFVLTADLSNITNYKDANNMISCRVYQLAI